MSNFTTQQQGQGAPRRTHPIRPLTIKQLVTAQGNTIGDGAMVIDNREVTQATVVGRIIRNMSDSGAALTARHQEYQISDNTGLIAVRQWMEGDQQIEPLPVGNHVRVSGTVKLWNNAPIITGTVVPIMDTNEVTYHMLDVILTHLRLTRGNRRPRASGGGASIANTAAAVGAQNVLPGGEKTVLLTELLMSTMKTNNSEMGYSLDDLLVTAQRYGFGINDVRTAMRTLNNEGRVYQTQDNRYNI